MRFQRNCRVDGFYTDRVNIVSVAMLGTWRECAARRISRPPGYIGPPPWCGYGVVLEYWFRHAALSGPTVPAEVSEIRDVAHGASAPIGVTLSFDRFFKIWSLSEFERSRHRVKWIVNVLRSSCTPDLDLGELYCPSFGLRKCRGCSNCLEGLP